jgi:hypothetical protein
MQVFVRDKVLFDSSTRQVQWLLYTAKETGVETDCNGWLVYKTNSSGHRIEGLHTALSSSKNVHYYECLQLLLQPLVYVGKIRC